MAEHVGPTNERIRRLEAKRAEMQAELDAAILEEQEHCPHDKVMEAPYHSSEYFGVSPAIRVCCQCGRAEYDRWGTELGGRWDAPAAGPISMEYGPPHKLTTKFIKRVSRHEIYGYRREVKSG